MSRRIPQIESTLKRAISQVLHRQMSDPRIAGLVSITQIKVSPDMREAFVYVSVLPEKYEKKTISGLRHATRHIHALTSKLVALRTVPHLDFRLDESLKRQAAVHEAIQKGLRRSGESETAEEDDRSNPITPSPQGPEEDVS